MCKKLTHIVRLILLFIGVVGLVSCNEKSIDQEPNIVYILADDMGFGDISCQNSNSKIETPNLDKLASQGMRFTDAHSGSSVCTPTRYGILTGRYCWRSSLKSGVLWTWDEPIIESERLTVADLLKKNGYTTACIGKWHLGWEWPTTDGTRIERNLKFEKSDMDKRLAFEKKLDFSKAIKNGPTTHGFDYYYGDDVPNFPPYCFIENNRVIAEPNIQKPPEMFGVPGPMQKGWDLEKVMPSITQKAVDYIAGKKAIFKRDSKKPFFLYFALTAPHTPIAPIDKFKGSSKAGAYGDFVQQVDWTVGQIMETLEEFNLAENTIIVFVSDNGSIGNDGTNMGGVPNSVHKYGHYPNHIYRGTKGDIYDGGHRIPFIVRWSSVIEPGIVCDETVCLTDFMATTAAIIGEELPSEVAEDSYNLLPLFKSVKLDEPIREATVHHANDGSFAIRKDEWKLIMCAGSGGWVENTNLQANNNGMPAVQLYKIDTDPAEMENLCFSYPGKVDELKKLLVKYINSGRSSPGENQQNDKVTEWEELNWMK